MITLTSVAPVLPVRNVRAASELYTRLGFEVEAFDEEYAFANRGDIGLHLAQVQRVKPHESMVAVYLSVSDAPALYQEWADAGVEGRLLAPQGTDYGLVEGAYVDPDGNLLRFGSSAAE